VLHIEKLLINTLQFFTITKSRHGVLNLDSLSTKDPAAYALIRAIDKNVGCPHRGRIFTNKNLQKKKKKIFTMCPKSHKGLYKGLVRKFGFY